MKNSQVVFEIQKISENISFGILNTKSEKITPKKKNLANFSKSSLEFLKKKVELLEKIVVMLYVPEENLGGLRHEYYFKISTEQSYKTVSNDSGYRTKVLTNNYTINAIGYCAKKNVYWLCENSCVVDIYGYKLNVPPLWKDKLEDINWKDLNSIIELLPDTFCICAIT